MPTNIDPNQIDVTTPIGQIAAGGLSITALIVGFFRLRKALRVDVAEGRQVEREDAYLTKLEKRVDDLEARSDKFASEKNEAVRAAAVLEGEIKALKVTILHLEEDRKAIKVMLDDVEARYKEVLAKNESLQEEIDKLQAVVERRALPRPEIGTPLLDFAGVKA